MNRRQLLGLAVSAAALGILSPVFEPVLWAAGPDPAIDALVAVTRTDGTVLRGNVISYDRDKLTLNVITKPKDPPVSTDIPWDQIKRVSNGLTRAKGLQRWKADHVNDLCVTCHGNGNVFCSTCHGTGHDPAASADCPICKGASQIVCTTNRCKHGIIPCTNPKCLKLTDGGWYKKPDGTRWKRFNGKGGMWFEWSEHHVGQVVDQVNGQWQNLGTCPVCGGVTTIGDPVCLATGETPCPRCTKKTTSPACPNKCEAGLVQCSACHGSGLKA